MATDNSDIEGKKMIRDWCMGQFGGAANCTVLELFGGMGHVHDHCYANPPVKKHLAFELRKVDRPTWISGDNRILLPNYVNANNGWDLYDLDAYSNPWILAMNVCKMRVPGTFTMAITCGLTRGLRAGHSNGYVRKVSGINWIPYTGLMARYYDDIIQLAVNDWMRFKVKIEKSVRITSNASIGQVKYYGFLVTKEKK